MIQRCSDSDLSTIDAIINDAATAYRGVIPPDRWHEPYMPREELLREIAAGVGFWGCYRDGDLVGVMGIQDVKDVTLIRHAYVRSAWQRSGVGRELLHHLVGLTDRPVLIGTWAAAHWAIAFYLRNGFTLVSPAEKEVLLRRYWTVPDRQIETSVVLADAKWRAGASVVAPTMRTAGATFRPIEARDIPALFAVRVRTDENRLTREQLASLGITEATVLTRLQTTFRGWVGEIDGHVVGFAMGDRSTGEMWVIAVLPGYIRRGIGSELLTRVEAWLESAGCRELWLTTDTDRSLRAYRFYRRHGWDEWKTENDVLYLRKRATLRAEA